MTIKEAAAEMIKAARELDQGLSGFELEVNDYRIVVRKREKENENKIGE